MEMGKMPKWKSIPAGLETWSRTSCRFRGSHTRMRSTRLSAASPSCKCVCGPCFRLIPAEADAQDWNSFFGGLKRRRDGCLKRKSVQSGWQTSALSYHPIFYPFIHYLPRPQRHNKLSCSNTYQVQHYVSNMLLATWLLLCKCSWLVFQTKPFPSALDNVCVQRLFLDCGWKYRC